MEPFTMAMMAAIQIGGSIAGYFIQQGKEAEADEILRKAQEEYGKVTPETLDQAAMDLMGPTEFNKIKTDPAFKQAQMESLDKIEELQAGGGFNAEDRAVLNRMRMENARATSSRNAQLREEMASRGIGGSGAELALRQASAQEEANRGQQFGLDTAAQAQRRYFDAIRERANMASGMREQDFGEQAARAAAQDRINQFNTGMKFDVHRYNQDVKQRNFANTLGMADRRYGFAADRAARIAGQGQRTGQMVGNIAQQAGGAVGAYGSYKQGLADKEDYWKRLKELQGGGGTSGSYGLYDPVNPYGGG